MMPQLRFPEFTDEWQVKKLGDVFDRVTRKNKENNQNILTISAQDGLVSQEKFFSKIVAAKDVSGYYLLHKNDYAYNKSYSKGYPMGAIKRLSREEKGVVSTLYICFSSKQGLELFFDQYFEAGRLNTEIEKIAQEGARNHGLLNMAVGDFFTTKLVIPVSKPEQEKIADFLTAVDERIAVGEKKLELLETYKRGVMQKIFSQQIRFKDDNGNDYPEWEEKKLKEVVEFIQNGLSVDQGAKGQGKKVTRIETISSNEIDPNKVGYIVTNKDISHYKLKKGDMLFSNINSPAHIGRIVYVKKDYDDIYHGMNLLRIRINELNNAKYIYYVLSSAEYKKWFERICNKAVNQASINQTDLGCTEIVLPKLDEQQKIATFLTTLDDKIKSEQTHLTAAKQWKKGLLQRMFV